MPRTPSPRPGRLTQSGTLGVHTGTGTRKNSRRVSLGGVPLSDSPQAERRVSLSRETFLHDEKKGVSMPADEEDDVSPHRVTIFQMLNGGN